MITALGICSFFLLGFTYLGYPIVLFVWATYKHNSKRGLACVKPLSFSIIIAARNEGKIIQQKLEDTLALEFESRSIREELSSASPRVQLLVASDASDDETHDVVNSFLAQGVKLVALPQRGGKEKAQIAAIKEASGDIVLFTDAKIAVSKNALSVLSREFSEPSVGAVSSRDVVVDDKGRSGEGSYVAYEMWLRRLESRASSLVGLSGSCFAVRKEITRNFPENMSSDFAMSLETRIQGFRSVHCDDLIGSYSAVASSGLEFARKVRTVLRGIRVLMLYKKLLNPLRYGTFAFQLISHKLLRWLSPPLFLCLCISIFALRQQGYFEWFLFAVMSIFIALAISAKLQPTLQSKLVFKLPLFFCVSQVAILVAWWKFYRGEESAFWTPSQKG